MYTISKKTIEEKEDQKTKSENLVSSLLTQRESIRPKIIDQHCIKMSLEEPHAHDERVGLQLEDDHDDIPWRQDPTLRRLDSTLTSSESATGRQTGGSGPFFWIAVSDLTRHCVRIDDGEGYESLQLGVGRFKLTNTCKYWDCYLCSEISDSEGDHISHLETVHAVKFSVLGGGANPSAGPNLSKLCLEDSITIDESCRYFLVDSTKLYDPLAEKRSGKERRERHIEIVNALCNQVGSTISYFHLRCKCLSDLELVNTIEPVLFSRGQALPVLVSWLHKLSSTVQLTGTIEQLQYRFLSKLLDRAHGKTTPGGSLSNVSVSEAFADMKRELNCELVRLDEQNKEADHKTNLLKHNLSSLAVVDHRTNIVPIVRSFLHTYFDFNNLRTLGCHNIKELLSSLNKFSVVPRADSFSVEVVSPGIVIINTNKNKSHWGLAFIRCSANYVGMWSCPEPEGNVELTGNFKFGGSLTWGPGPHKGSVSVTFDDHDAYKTMNSWGLRLENDLWQAIGDRLFCLKDKYFNYMVGMQ